LIRVLFVCMGNICRSPTAHGVFESLVQRSGLAHRIEVDSAGTHAYHVGEPPDARSQQVAKGRGVDLSGQRARRVQPDDFRHFDYLVAMDRDNYRELQRICPAGLENKLRLFMEFAPESGVQEVPDPYYGGSGGFERVFRMVEEAADGLLEKLRKDLN
jgi:protein-tyrosine phosphatase